MGLDAVVYKNRGRLDLGADEKAAPLIPETGETYFEDDEISKRHRHERHAAEHRLGNVMEIAELREEVIRLIGPKSVIVERVLYSGSHSGDAIPLESLSTFAAELDSISNARQRSSELQDFITSFRELIRIAGEEGNPIVFV